MSVGKRFTLTFQTSFLSPITPDTQRCCHGIQTFVVLDRLFVASQNVAFGLWLWCSITYRAYLSCKPRQFRIYVFRVIFDDGNANHQLTDSSFELKGWLLTLWILHWHWSIEFEEHANILVQIVGAGSKPAPQKRLESLPGNQDTVIGTFLVENRHAKSGHLHILSAMILFWALLQTKS